MSSNHNHSYLGSPMASSLTLHDSSNNSANVSRNPSSAGRSGSGHLSPSPAQYATYNDPFAAPTGPVTPKSAKSVSFTDRPVSESTLYDHNGEHPLNPVSPMKSRQIRDSTHLIPTPIANSKDKRFVGAFSSYPDFFLIVF